MVNVKTMCYSATAKAQLDNFKSSTDDVVSTVHPQGHYNSLYVLLSRPLSLNRWFIDKLAVSPNLRLEIDGRVEVDASLCEHKKETLVRK